MSKGVRVRVSPSVHTLVNSECLLFLILFICVRIDIIERKEEILKWIESNQSKSYMSKKLRCKPETLNSYLVKMGIDYSGNQGGNGIKTDCKRISALEYAKTHGCKSSDLKKKLIEEGYVENICVWCKNEGEWKGKPITLELDHIDGNRYNNELENLRILCPNCHSQTPTFRGRNNDVDKKRVNNCIDCGFRILKKSIRCIDCNRINRFK